jgi:hypothetical protein
LEACDASAKQPFSLVDIFYDSTVLNEMPHAEVHLLLQRILLAVSSVL